MRKEQARITPDDLEFDFLSFWEETYKYVPPNAPVSVGYEFLLAIKRMLLAEALAGKLLKEILSSKTEERGDRSNDRS